MLMILTPADNFNNILRANFLPISFCQKVSKPNNPALQFLAPNYWRIMRAKNVDEIDT